jgi:hypothetical protein
MSEIQHPGPAGLILAAAATDQPADPAAPAQLVTAMEQQLQALELTRLQQLQEQQQHAEAASAQVPNEEAWKVLLERLAQWEPHLFDEALSVPQQHIICKLLCCSTAMTDLIYRACQGQLRASMMFFDNDESEVRDSSTVPQHESAGRWLAKHAALLQELEVVNPGSRIEIEDAIAAGLQAASGRSMSAPEDRARSSSPLGLGCWPRPARPVPPVRRPRRQQQQQQQQGTDSSTPSRLLLKAATSISKVAAAYCARLLGGGS